jgi:hypothetical protein
MMSEFVVLSCVISSLSETFHSKCLALLPSETLYKVQYFQTYCTCFDKAGYGEEEVVSSDGCDIPWNLVISSTVKECQSCLAAAMSRYCAHLISEAFCFMINWHENEVIDYE